MNYNEIAVQFNNLTEREQIINKFKSEGFKLAPNIISVDGRIGYSEMCRYVCVLTDYGLEGKKFISFEEFTKESQMKKLNIKKDYRLEKGIVVNHISDIETEVKLLNDTADVITTIIIGRYGVNLDKANEIIKLFNIPYELVDETDWNKVEDGTEIKIIDNGNIVKFMKYIPDLKTVIVREGDYFYTIDASEVELCEKTF